MRIKTSKRLRIAIVHSYYSSRSPSGENVVVDAQHSALEAAGFEVKVIAARTDEAEKTFLHTGRAAVRVASGRGQSPLAELNAFSPDVVHVHNLFPNFSRSWVDRWTGPLVATLHNFRPVCAAGTLYRDGAMCTLCPDHGSINSIRHACYRDSSVATIPLAIATRRGVPGDALLARADRIIVLSERARGMYAGYGLPVEKMDLIPNFVPAEGFAPNTSRGSHWLYLGRLAAEKGILDLIAAWPDGHRLVIHGDGPLRAETIAAVTARRPWIEYRGAISRESVPETLAQSVGLVFPSKWAEGAVPLTYVESLAAGRPVVAMTGNGAADDIRENGTGAVVDDWHHAGPVLSRVAGSDPIADRARTRYEEAFGVDAWLDATARLYESVAARKNSQ